MKYAIYIPTKNREAFAVRCVNSLVNLQLGLPIIIATEKQHYPALRQALPVNIKSNPEVEVMLIRARDRGIGYARHEIVNHAFANRHFTIAMIDDDQDMTGDVNGWLKAGNRTDVVGIGSWKSYYGLLWNGTAIANNIKQKGAPGLYGCAGAQGHQAVVLNVRNALAVGGHDPNLRWGEDGDLARKGISHGYPWWVYTGCRAGDFATQRFLRANKVGGLQTPGALDSVHANHVKCYQRFPRYVSSPDKRYSIRWKKMWEENIPGWPIFYWPPGNVRSDRTHDWNDQ